MRLIWISILLVMAFGRMVAADRTTAAPPLQWQVASNRVDARITGWPLTKVLERLVRATGWDVFVEPGMDRTINATFSDLPAQEALTRLLGGLNFSLQPQPGAPSRLLIYQTDRASATRRVENPVRPGKIPNELIVRLKPGSKISIEELARQVGGKVVGKVDQLNAYRLQFETPEAAEAARRLLAARTDEVAAVENNYRWEPPAEMTAGSAPAASPSVLRPKLSPDGKNLVVGIIDTAAQTLAPDREALILSRTDLVPGQPTDDHLWHGTAMAETFFQGVSQTENSDGTSAVRLRLYNVYGDNESATSFDVTRAVFLAAQDGVSELSLSFGGPDDSPMLSDALESFVQQGGLVFAAVGNQGSELPFYPANHPWVVAVGAFGRDGQRASWSNYGSYVDVGAPGTSVVPFGDMYWRVSGTSPATALTAGMGAGYAARTGASLSAVGGVVIREMPFSP